MNRYTVIDLETTGNSPSEENIIEIGIVVIEGKEIVDDYSLLLKPEKQIPPYITKLTGIEENDVENAPSFSEKAEEVISYFGNNSYFVAHNVPFDLSFLNNELKHNGYPTLSNRVIDTVELSRILLPKSTSYRLNQLAKYFNITHRNPHRARSDAYVTAELFIKLIEKLEQLPFETLSHISKLERLFRSDLSQLLNDLLQKNNRLTSKQIHSFGGLAFKHTDIESTEPTQIEQSFGDLLDQVYGDQGLLQKKLRNYELRVGQQEMSETIYDAFRLHKHALIEAETGIGKSLAYLIPAIFEALTNKKRVIISTFTTQLQKQLMDKEIPLLKQIFPYPFQAAVLKGKQNYISLKRLSYTLHSIEYDPNNYDDILTLAKLLVWITETETGDIDEITLPASGYLFFKSISAETEGNGSNQSNWYSYYRKAHEKARHTNIVITNHALFCTDLFQQRTLLPSYQKAIIDEAHHFENSVSKYAGVRLNYIEILHSLQSLFEKRVDDQGKSITFEKLSYELCTDTKYELDHLFRSLFQYVKNKQNKALYNDIGRIQYSINVENDNDPKWNDIQEKVARLLYFFRNLIKLADKIKENGLEPIQPAVDQLNQIITGMEHFFFLENHSFLVAKWIEISLYGPQNAVYLYVEPIDVSDQLKRDLFEKKDSVIMTSATLTMKNTFEHMKAQVGLQQMNPIEKKYNSPFSFGDQVQLFIPNDFPSIKDTNNDDFVYATAEVILSLAEITDGGTLVLFTSYEMIRRTYNLLKEMEEVNPFSLIAQGISSGSRQQLKKRFQTNERSILLGTSSFWEGVDIPGNRLSAVIIVRLPFQRPTHPVHEAKSNYLKSIGKNPFSQFALPNAILRFKQGFGRLIRSKKDRGVIFICDARIMTTRYGEAFIESIPTVPIMYDSTYQLLNKADHWFNKK